MKKSILFSAAAFAYCILQTANCFPQGTAVNTNGSAADSSAIMDVSSDTQGLLIPRMTEAQKNAIPRPAPSLLIYQLDGTQPGYYFNAGDKTTKNWMYVGGDDLGNHTATDSLNMSNQKIVNLATCTYNYDAANKLYVDNKVGAGGGGGGGIQLTMMSDESLSTMNFGDALRYCHNLSESGFTDWSLPTFTEAAYLLSKGGSIVPGNSSANYFWLIDRPTATGSAAHNWLQLWHLSDGSLASSSTGSNLYYVRCVR